jgi:hypothetical protein
MWPGPSSVKFNAVSEEKLNDQQGNHIAIFQNDIDGAAAQFDLLQRAYVGRTIRDALDTWGGGNGLDSYCEQIERDTGLGEFDRLTAAYLRDPKTGVLFCKSMAKHEAGMPYPMSDADWRVAQKMALGGDVLKKSWLRTVNNNSVAARGLGQRVLARAKTYLGEQEDDELTQQHIVEWAHLLGRKDVPKNGAFAWCADFVGGLCVLEGAQVPAPADALLARKYLNVGIRIEPEDAQPGDLCIKERGQGMGHIGIIDSVDLENRTFVPIAGNSDDMVRYEDEDNGGPWHMDSDELLGIVRLVPSKLRPNGTKSIPDTISDSPSLRVQCNAIIAATGAAVVSGYETVVSYVEWIFGIAPSVADNASQAVGTTRQMAEHVGVSLPAKVLVGVALACMVSVIVRQLRQKSTGDVVQAKKFNFGKWPFTKATTAVPAEVELSSPEAVLTIPADDPKMVAKPRSKAKAKPKTTARKRLPKRPAKAKAKPAKSKRAKARA